MAKKRKAKGRSVKSLQTEVDLKKSAFCQKHVSSMSYYINATEGEIVGSKVSELLRSKIDDNVLNMSEIDLYSWVTNILNSEFNYDEVNEIRSEKYKSLTCKPLFSTVNGGCGRNKNSYLGMVTASTTRSMWCDVEIGEYVVSLGYIFKSGLNNPMSQDEIDKVWNELMDGISFNEVEEKYYVIEPITKFGVNVRPKGNFQSKQHYVVRNISLETSLLLTHIS